MNRREQNTRQRPFRIKKVHGEPFQLGDRQLIPVVRVLSFGKARATIGARGMSGWGAGWERVVPIALIEKTAAGESSIPITDVTAVALRSMLVAAVLVTVFLTGIRCLARRRR
jgi:hypothetical protein